MRGTELNHARRLAARYHGLLDLWLERQGTVTQNLQLPDRKWAPLISSRHRFSMPVSLCAPAAQLPGPRSSDAICASYSSSNLKLVRCIWAAASNRCLNPKPNKAEVHNANHGQQQINVGGVRRCSGPRVITGSRGAYQFIKLVGFGGWGHVYSGVNLATGEPVAIKTLENADLKQRSQAYRITATREISAMMSLRHPYIVALYDVVYNPSDEYGQLCLVMEYMSHGDVRKAVESAPEGHLSEAHARWCFQQLIDAVTFCHKKKVTHRDIKPDNMLLGEMGNMKVADFGISSIGPQEMPSSPGSVPAVRADDRANRLFTTVGTIHYEAPEVVANGFMHGGYQGAPADIWSCGAVLYYMLAGHNPFDPGDFTASGNLNMFPVSDAELRDRILTARYTCPAHFSYDVQHLLKLLLNPDPRHRISGADIYRVSWFQVGYKPPDYEQIWEVRANHAAIEALFHTAPDPQFDAVPAPGLTFALPRPERNWVHRDVPVDRFTFGSGHPGYEGEGNFLVEDVSMKYWSPAPPEQLKYYIEALVRSWGLICNVRSRQFLMNIQFQLPQLSPGEFKEPLEVLVDIMSPAEARGQYVIYFRKVTGDPADYAAFKNMVDAGSRSFMQEIP